MLFWGRNEYMEQFLVWKADAICDGWGEEVFKVEGLGCEAE